jgi:hypothetical protein
MADDSIERITNNERVAALNDLALMVGPKGTKYGALSPFLSGIAHNQETLDLDREA